MRQIEPKMVEYIDKKLAGNGLAEHAIAEKDARTLFRLAAQACIGIREVGGNNKGPMVELIQKTIGSADREAWCMAFVQTCLAYAELKTGVKSPIYPTEHCMTAWRKTSESQRVKISPLPGAIVIWKHGDTDSGHTGVVDGCNEEVFTAYEGNTESGLNSKGKVERDGGGVYYTRRDRKGSGSMKVVGFLKPF